MGRCTVGGGVGRFAVGGDVGKGLFGGSVGRVMLGGGVGRGILGGGTGGGRPTAGIFRLGPVLFRDFCACCDALGALGGTGVVESLRPGTNDGVEDMARTGREDDKKGAGSERIWTDVGRRSVGAGLAE